MDKGPSGDPKTSILHRGLTRRDFMKLATIPPVATVVATAANALNPLIASADGPQPTPTITPTHPEAVQPTPPRTDPVRVETPKPPTVLVAEADGNGNIALPGFQERVGRAKNWGTDTKRAYLPAPETLHFMDRDEYVFITHKNKKNESRRFLAHSFYHDHIGGSPVYKLRFPKGKPCQIPELGMSYDPTTGMISGLQGNPKEELGEIPHPMGQFSRRVDDPGNVDDLYVTNMGPLANGDGHISRFALKAPRINGDNVEIDISHMIHVALIKADGIYDTMYQNPRVVGRPTKSKLQGSNIDQINYTLADSHNVEAPIVQQVGTTFTYQGPLFDGNTVIVDQEYFHTPHFQETNSNAFGEWKMEKMRIGGAKVKRRVKIGDGIGWEDVTVGFRRGFIRDYARYSAPGGMNQARQMIPQDLGIVALVDNRVRTGNEEYDSLLLIPINDPVAGNPLNTTPGIAGTPQAPVQKEEFSLWSFGAGALVTGALGIMNMLRKGNE